MTHSAPQGPPPQGYAPPPGYQLKRKRRKWPWLLLGLVAVIVVIAVAANAGKGGGGSSGSSVHVVYSVTSDAPTALVTYATLNNGNLGEQQDTAAAMPWSKSLDVADSFVKSFTLTASMTPDLSGGGAGGSTITCTITVDGKTVATQTSHGPGATVTCSSAG